MAPILKAYARFKAAKIKEVILNESTHNSSHSVNNGNSKNQTNRAPSEISIDEAILRKMADAQLCGTFNKSHVCRIL